MIMQAVVPLILSLVSTGGFYTTYYYGHHSKRFIWSRYWGLTTIPLMAVLFLVIWVGVNVAYLFVLSMGVGLVFEWGVGRAYHKTLRHRLWTYHRYTIGGYTSWLAAPMWGVAGVVFWLLSKIVGL